MNDPLIIQPLSNYQMMWQEVFLTLGTEIRVDYGDFVGFSKGFWVSGYQMHDLPEITTHDPSLMIGPKNLHHMFAHNSESSINKSE